MEGMNPETFDVQKLKLFGMWPPANLIAADIMPYIRRMKVDNVTIGIFGDTRGENVVAFAENNESKKINKIYWTDYPGTEICKSNLKSAEENVPNIITDNRDILEKALHICVIDSSFFDRVDIDTILPRMYESVKDGGMFVGGGHDNESIKAKVKLFRQQLKITAPISVVNRHIWFWNKPKTK